ncbi:MAG: hypothetical protein FWG72_10325 [Oscillospiraceae bacterium]|nr:hypothetical protein [Oscillospiraceae bacterium]
MRQLKKLLALAVVLALSVSFVLPAMAKSIDDFADAAAAKDVLAEKGGAGGPLEGVYTDAVQFMIDLNVLVGKDTLGDGNLTLALGDELTRAEFAVLLYKALNGGKAIEENGLHFIAMPGVFNDTAGEWYHGYANAFGALGISAGVSSDPENPLFGGSQTITFNEALLLSMKAIGLNTDREPGFVFNSMSVLGLATNLGMLQHLVPTPNGNIDRAGASLLLNHTITVDGVGYSVSVGGGFVREQDKDSLLESKFGFTKVTGTVMSDGKWISIDGKPLPARGGARILVGSKDFELTADATEALGITVDDIGRSIEFMYDVDKTDGQGDYTTVVPRKAYKDNEFVTLNGFPQDASDGYNPSLAYLASSQTGMSLAVDDAKIFVNYVNSPTLEARKGDIGYDNLVNLNGARGDGFSIRVVYDGPNPNWGNKGVLYVFIETYDVMLYRDISSGRVRSQDNSPTWNALGNAPKEPANILGWPSAVEANDAFMWIALPNNKAKVVPVTTTVEGVLNSRAADGGTATLGTQSFSRGPIRIDNDVLGTSIGATYKYFAWNGKIAASTGGPAAAATRPNSFALVIDAWAVPSAYEFGRPTEYTRGVQLLLEDGSRPRYELDGVYATSWDNGWIVGAARDDLGTNNSGIQAQLLENVYAFSADNGKVRLFNVALTEDFASLTGKTARGANENFIPSDWFTTSGQRAILSNTVSFIIDESGANNAYLVYRGTRLPATSTLADLTGEGYVSSPMSGNPDNSGTGGLAVRAMLFTINGDSGFEAPTNDGKRYAYILGTPRETADGVGVVRVMFDDGTVGDLSTRSSGYSTGTVANSGGQAFKDLRAKDLIIYDHIGEAVVNGSVEKISRAGANWAQAGLFSDFDRIALTGIYAANSSFTQLAAPAYTVETLTPFGGDDIKVMVVQKHDDSIDESVCAIYTAAEAEAADLFAGGAKREALWSASRKLLIINAEPNNSVPAVKVDVDLGVTANWTRSTATWTPKEGHQWVANTSEDGNHMDMWNNLFDYNYFAFTVASWVAAPTTLEFIINCGGSVPQQSISLTAATVDANGAYYVDLNEVIAASTLDFFNPDFGWGVQVILMADTATALTEMGTVTGVKFTDTLTGTKIPLE